MEAAEAAPDHAGRSLLMPYPRLPNRLSTEPPEEFGNRTRSQADPLQLQAGGGAGPTIDLGLLWRRRSRRREDHRPRFPENRDSLRRAFVSSWLRRGDDAMRCRHGALAQKCDDPCDGLSIIGDFCGKAAMSAANFRCNFDVPFVFQSVIASIQNPASSIKFQPERRK